MQPVAIIFWLLSLLAFFPACKQGIVPLPRAHAHNDYEHERPLFEALGNGFTSVEADVHLIDDKLFVSHDAPANLRETKTLDELYLNPLRDHVRKNHGRVYKGYDDYFYLMVDIKSPAEPTYRALRALLATYGDLVSIVTNTSDKPGRPVKIVLSGNRPVAMLLRDSVKYAALDGRPEDLGKGISVALMPIVSQAYSKYLTWRGDGDPDEGEIRKLQSMIETAHGEGKRVRLWGAPDKPEAWKLLSDAGVDLINTDDLSGLRAFLLSGE